MKKKILALLLAAAVVMSLAACGGDANQGGNTPANADQSLPARRLPMSLPAKSTAWAFLSMSPTTLWTPPPTALSML